MANFVIIVDPDAETRSRYIEKIKPLLPPFEGLIINSCEVGDFSAIWAANPQAPISYQNEEEGAGIIWGDAIFQRESKRVDPATLRKLWKNPNSESPIFDGFYAATVYHPEEGLAVGADIIGLFPVYYYQGKDVILVGSSPELFRYHPLFKAEFNPAGFVGIILTNGLFEGETLWKNVRRLEPGHLLFFPPQKPPKEIKQYQVAAIHSKEKKELSLLPFEEQINILGETLGKTLQRQAVSNIEHSLLLSGGLDSRTLAGYLHHQGVPTLAVTLGRKSDFEVEGAKKIADVLEMPQHLTTLPFEEYPIYLERLVKWEHLSSGCTRCMFWGMSPLLRPLAPRFVAGFSLELMMGGKGAYTVSPNNTFEQFFAKGVNNWGLSERVLEKLLRKEVFGDLVPETIEKIKAVYNNYSSDEFKRALCFDLYHRQRFHVGSSAWQMCFGAWPVLPYLDKELLEVADAMPTKTIAERRAQKAILCQQFPALSQIPLVHNSAFTTIPIIPQNTSIAEKVNKKILQIWHKIENKLGYERRYFCRIYDINRQGWQAIRENVESERNGVSNLFNMAEFNRVILPPERRIPCDWDPPKSAAVKTLLGFLLWSKNHL
jgi:asparagine synthase (glutamine-hydrolysing)